MNKDLNIYVFTYKKPSFSVINDETHIPLQVGASCTKEDICFYKDDVLDNISDKNPMYSELTGLYWVWKNMIHTPYIGCEHFRRHFDLEDDEVAAMHVFAKSVALAIQQVFPCKKVGVAVIGLEVPHAHIHLIPIQNESDMLFSNPKLKLSGEEFVEIAKAINEVWAEKQK